MLRDGIHRVVNNRASQNSTGYGLKLGRNDLINRN
jgi:hypothetical protein